MHQDAAAYFPFPGRRCCALLGTTATAPRLTIASLKHGLGRGAGLLSLGSADSKIVPAWARRIHPRRGAHNANPAAHLTLTEQRPEDLWSSAAQDRWAQENGSHQIYLQGKAKHEDAAYQKTTHIQLDSSQSKASEPTAVSVKKKVYASSEEDKAPTRRAASKTILKGGLSHKERVQRKAHLKRIAETVGITEANATQRRLEREDALRKQQRKEFISRLRPYMERQLRLIELEAEEQRKEVEIRKSWSVDKMTKEGYALDGMEGYWLQKEKEKPKEGGPTKSKKSASFSAIRTAVFHRPGKARLGWTRLQKGDQVELKASGSAKTCERLPETEDTCVATVRSISDTEVRLNFEAPFHDLDLLANPFWYMEMAYNDLIEQRLVQSVEALVHDVEATRRAGAELSGTRLVDMLLDESAGVQQRLKGLTVAQYIKDNCAGLDEPDYGNLNETQRWAISLMFSEPVSLIQGPPGTGKTSTIVEAIRLLKHHYKVPHTILLTSHTNVAVDNLAQGCKEAGLHVIRAGTPVRVRDSLTDVTVEGRMEKHPSKPHLDELEASKIATIRALQQLQGMTEELAEDPMGEKARPNSALEQEIDDDIALLFAGAQYPGGSSDLQRLQKKLSLLIQKTYVLRRDMERDIYADVDVVCCTALSAPLIRVVDFPIVFFDEASMATEPVTIATMIKGCQQLSLIGDQQQLSPLVKSREVQEEGLGVSLFERLMEGGKLPSVMLNTQHRMHPSLSDFPNHEFYEGRLSNSDSTAELEPLQSCFIKPGTHLSFIDHNGRESMTKNKSLENNREADLIINIIADVLCKNESVSGADIGIITPYLGQKELLWKSMQDPMSYHRDLLAKEVERLGGSKSRLSEIADIEIHTIDGFEGREKKVIVMSLVRANTFGYLGFLKEEKRWNVALTRAKNALIIVGNAFMLNRNKTNDDGEEIDGDTFLHRYADHLRQHDCIIDIESVLS